jgi:putative PIN family toxin of toxin-antitoxin system
MQKIVIDTNVLVSGLIQQGYPYLIVNNLFIEQKISLCVSYELLAEYYEVLKRKKFSRYPDFLSKAESLLAQIETKSITYTPTFKLDIISDKDDNKLLELASESNANFLITGNTNDFTMKKYRRTSIVSPKDYWNSYKPKN